MSAWPTVRLGDVLIEQKQRIGTFDADNLPLLGVSNHAGLQRSNMPRIANMSRYFRVEQDWFAYNPMRINVGSIGWAETPLQTGVISPDYVVFSCMERVVPQLLFWFLKHPQGLSAINKVTAGSVRERLYFDALAQIEFPLPPIAEQRRIVARIQDLAAQIHEARTLRAEIEDDLTAMLGAAHHKIADGAPTKPLCEVAPLKRRPVTVELDKNYPQVSARSFGRGTFHKPPLHGSEITWQKPFRVEAGDILVSNIKAWEGALAVATPDDHGRVGSHRYLTFVPEEGVATAKFLCFYLLTPEGLHAVGEASPGSADRNRTLSAKAFLRIPVPVPAYEKQTWFDSLCREADALKSLQAETAAELDAMLPAILDRAFKGEL